MNFHRGVLAGVHILNHDGVASMHNVVLALLIQLSPHAVWSRVFMLFIKLVNGVNFGRIAHDVHDFCKQLIRSLVEIVIEPYLAPVKDLDSMRQF